MNRTAQALLRAADRESKRKTGKRRTERKKKPRSKRKKQSKSPRAKKRSKKRTTKRKTSNTKKRTTKRKTKRASSSSKKATRKRAPTAKKSKGAARGGNTEQRTGQSKQAIERKREAAEAKDLHDRGKVFATSRSPADKLAYVSWNPQQEVYSVNWEDKRGRRQGKFVKTKGKALAALREHSRGQLKGPSLLARGASRAKQLIRTGR